MTLTVRPKGASRWLVLLAGELGTRDDLARTLPRDSGFELIVAASAEEAIESAHRHRPDAIVSDVQLGAIDGFSLCGRIRDDPSLSRTPVLLLLRAPETESDRALARRVGATCLVPRTQDVALALAAVRENAAGTLPGAAPGVDGMNESARQGSRAEALAQFTAGVAHDFNNVLSAITANSYFLIESFGDADPRKADAQEIRNAAEVATSLTRQLLTFSHRAVPAPATTTLSAVVLGMQRLLRRLVSEDVRLKVDIAPDAGFVRVDVGEIEQVVMNRSLDARRAMPRGGTLTIGVRNVEVDRAPPEGSPTLAPGRYVELSIAADGGGRTDGAGTLVTLHFPRVDEPCALSATPGGPREPSLVVLVVEDDARLRTVIHRILEKSGYRVLLASSAEDALDLLSAHRGRLDVVLTDVVMPGASGPELVEDLRERYPDAKCIFMSGHSDHPALRGTTLRSPSSFMAKPFTPEALTARIRDVMNS